MASDSLISWESHKAGCDIQYTDISLFYRVLIRVLIYHTKPSLRTALALLPLTTAWALVLLLAPPGMDAQRGASELVGSPAAGWAGCDPHSPRAHVNMQVLAM